MAATEKPKENTRIILCPNCKPHEFQDKKYGQKMRLHNLAPGSKKIEVKHRCTVCLSVK